MTLKGFDNYLIQYLKRLNLSNQFRQEIQNNYNKKYKEVQNHFEEIVKKQIDFLRDTMLDRVNLAFTSRISNKISFYKCLQLRIEFNKLDGDIETAQNEAYKKRSVAEEHLRAYLQKKKEDEEKKRRDDEKMIADDDDLDYVDTLMINEEGDIDDNNNDVDFILNDKLSIDGLVQQVEDYINTKLVICMPNLSEHCFIHYESQQKIGTKAILPSSLPSFTFKYF